MSGQPQGQSVQDRLDFDDIVQLAERESGAYGLADAALLARVAEMVERFNARGPMRLIKSTRCGRSSCGCFRAG